MRKISDIIKNKFPYEPTRDQMKLFLLFDQLLIPDGPSALLVKGYAGTGKTSIVSTLVQVLPLFNFRYMLLAPTGRAAKVLSSYSGRKAFTIHKIIYRVKQERDSSKFHFERIKNYHKNTVFIVDEASMIHDQDSLGQSNLLKDLIRYIYENSTNKLILIGDTAQLPPVGHEYSGALDKENLVLTYKLDVREIELTEVVRQESNSGILKNATHIRDQISAHSTEIHLGTRNMRDIFSMKSDKMEDGIRYAYDKYGIEGTIVICRSNRDAIAYNQFIRRNILFYDNHVDTGDYLVIVRNNYAWLGEDSAAGFLANGDFAEIMKISNMEDCFGFSFADLELRLVDYPEHPKFTAKANLNTLYAPAASLSDEDNRKLYDTVLQNFYDTKGRELKEALASDPYLNALQVKFTYAITCHKSQGGQWPAVFLDQGFLKEDMIDSGYLRWLYTGITRATKELYLVNFNPDFFPAS